MKLIKGTILSTLAVSLLLTGCSSSPPESTGNASVTQAAKSTVSTEKPSAKPVEKEKPAATPTKSPEKPSTQPTKPAQDGAALTALGKLEVKDKFATGYNRAKSFGTPWADVNGYGCDTREATLAIHMKNVVKGSDGCKVLSGTLDDQYTGKAFKYISDSSGGGIDIDHVVALSAGYKTGMDRYTPKVRLAFANDPLNIIPVDAGLNRFKGDSSADEWLPSGGKDKLNAGKTLNSSFDCPYVARQIAVKSKYQLWVTTPEKKMMTTVLASCPEAKLPASTLKVDLSKGTSSSSFVNADSGKTDSKDKSTKSVKPPVQPIPKSTKPSTGKTDPNMGTCAKAKAKGFGPYVKGTNPEYSFYRDNDKDGRVCE